MSRLIAALFVFAVVAVSGAAQAFQPFDRQAFMKAQEMGEPILVHVYASWCPTCKAQAPVVAMLEKENPALKVFRVDFDSQKDAVRDFGAKSQSTLISFSGKRETGRATDVTDPMKIRELVGTATMPMGMDKGMGMEKPMDKKM